LTVDHHRHLLVSLSPLSVHLRFWTARGPHAPDLPQPAHRADRRDRDAGAPAAELLPRAAPPAPLGKSARIAVSPARNRPLPLSPTAHLSHPPRPVPARPCRAPVGAVAAARDGRTGVSSIGWWCGGVRDKGGGRKQRGSCSGRPPTTTTSRQPQPQKAYGPASGMKRKASYFSASVSREIHESRLLYRPVSPKASNTHTETHNQSSQAPRPGRRTKKARLKPPSLSTGAGAAVLSPPPRAPDWGLVPRPQARM
jgi:hypothetical protein